MEAGLLVEESAKFKSPAAMGRGHPLRAFFRENELSSRAGVARLLLSPRGTAFAAQDALKVEAGLLVEKFAWFKKPGCDGDVDSPLRVSSGGRG